ncbi:hypothetical protein PCE1_003389 [Barthelona sp. PCE]
MLSWIECIFILLVVVSALFVYRFRGLEIISMLFYVFIIILFFISGPFVTQIVGVISTTIIGIFPQRMTSEKLIGLGLFKFYRIFRYRPIYLFPCSIVEYLLKLNILFEGPGRPFDEVERFETENSEIGTIYHRHSVAFSAAFLVHTHRYLLVLNMMWFCDLFSLIYYAPTWYVALFSCLYITCKHSLLISIYHIIFLYCNTSQGRYLLKIYFWLCFFDFSKIFAYWNTIYLGIISYIISLLIAASFLHLCSTVSLKDVKRRRLAFQDIQMKFFDRPFWTAHDSLWSHRSSETTHVSEQGVAIFIEYIKKEEDVISESPQLLELPPKEVPGVQTAESFEESFTQLYGMNTDPVSIAIPVLDNSDVDHFSSFSTSEDEWQDDVSPEHERIYIEDENGYLM